MIELVRDKERRIPLAPFNGSSPKMTSLAHTLRREGLYTMLRWNGVFTNPPLSITEAELKEGFAIIDRALDETDRAVES